MTVFASQAGFVLSVTVPMPLQQQVACKRACVYGSMSRKQQDCVLLFSTLVSAINQPESTKVFLEACATLFSYMCIWAASTYLVKTVEDQRIPEGHDRPC